jgi:hypothetical protein
MDCRVTLSNNDSFLSLLEHAYSSGERVNVLFDEKGMTRAEGLIKMIHTDNSNPFIEIENGFKILVKDIIAVNGIFLSEYGEC